MFYLTYGYSKYIYNTFTCVKVVTVNISNCFFYRKKKYILKTKHRNDQGDTNKNNLTDFLKISKTCLHGLFRVTLYALYNASWLKVSSASISLTIWLHSSTANDIISTLWMGTISIFINLRSNVNKLEGAFVNRQIYRWIVQFSNVRCTL